MLTMNYTYRIYPDATQQTELLEWLETCRLGQFKSFVFPQFKDNPINGFSIKLPKIGEVPINLHRPIPDGFKVNQVRVLSKSQRREDVTC